MFNRVDNFISAISSCIVVCLLLVRIASKMDLKIHFITILLAAATVCDAAKILAVLPMPSKSHHYIMQPIIRGLAEKGHEITFYTPISLGKNYTNVKEIELRLPIEEAIQGFDFNTVRELGQVPIVNLISFWPFGLGVCNDTLSRPEVQKLINSNEKFDLIILEAFFGQEAFLAFGHKFNAPVVSLATFSTFSFIDEFVGNPFALSYIPGFELPYDNDMTFIQRVHNTVRAISTLLVGYYFYLPYQNTIMRTYFNYKGSETIPPVTEMMKNVSLVVFNSQIAVDYPRPFLPNMITVAGLHIAPKNKPLPKDLKDFLDNSKQGVIYVSFGSLVPAEKMPEEMRSAFINAFGKVKQNILWKLPIDKLPGLPKNIKLSKWLPQQDVLAHPNIKGFITHGGLLSQEEAVYFGVPLISVPYFGDQYMNAKRAAKCGFAVYLDSFNITEESISWSLNEILNNPKYQENAKLHSRIFKDNPQPPIEKALYWVEYVLRFNGAPHLRSDARNNSYPKYLLLDVFAFLALILYVILFSVYKIVKFMCSLCCNKSPKVKTSKKKN